MFSKKNILFLLFLLNAGVYSQSIYVPLEFQAAYEEGTRSLDGKPGTEYWQNHSDYKISARLDPLTGILKGSANIIYYNSSPDTLDKLVLRLYPNIFKRDAMRDFPLKTDDDQAGMVLQTISVGKKIIDPKTDTSLENTGTNLVIKDITVNPGKQTTINLSWEFRIPRENGLRMGRYDSAVFFIAYWYPQIAVYDDIDGWDMTEYTGNTEFYNDFNNYDVKITVPNNYCVWGTGELQNPEELFAPQILSKYAEANTSFNTINIITAQDYEPGIIIFSNELSLGWKTCRCRRKKSFCRLSLQALLAIVLRSV